VSQRADDRQVRRHMDAVEECLRRASQLQHAAEVQADLRRRLEEAEARATGAEAVARMLSYCRGCGCEGYPGLCGLTGEKAPPRTLTVESPRMG
jgi:hypothetical protein